jgi:hypothetical protein
VQFSAEGLRGKPLPAAFPGQTFVAMRKPVFDIVIKAQKRSPYSKMAQNELAKEMYQLGFFNPQLAEQSLAALDLMDFEGKEKVREKVQQGQTLLNQMAAMQQQMEKMAFVIQHYTGQNVLDPAQPVAAARRVPAGEVTSGMGGEQKEAMKETMTAYGQRLAERAKPDMDKR